MSGIETLRANIESGRLRSSEFARSLLGQFDRRGDLSPAQWAYVDKLNAQVAAPAKPVEKVGDGFGAILELFATAKDNGLKTPKIRLMTEGGQRLMLKPAPDNSRLAGRIMITDGGGYGQSRYFGSVDSNGQFQTGRDKAPAEVLAYLKAFNQDAAAQAKAYGQKTGNCCFCGLELREALSIATGVGPICAERFGVDRGAIAEAREADQVDLLEGVE